MFAYGRAWTVHERKVFHTAVNWVDSCDRAQCLAHIVGKVEHILHSCDVAQD